MAAPSIVLIWNNNTVLNLRSHKVTGHASINIGNEWSRQSMLENYVSWFPKGANGTSNRLGRANDTNFGKVGFLSDLEEEKYLPDHIIVVRLPFIDEMKQAWQEIRTKPGAHWLRYRKNCSTICARILRAGADPDSFGRMTWSAHSAIWTPLKVKRFAYHLGGTDIDWTDLLNVLTSRDAVTPQDKVRMKDLYKREDSHGDPRIPSRYVGGRDTKQKSAWDFLRPARG